jgi:hypothetical protein
MTALVLAAALLVSPAESERPCDLEVCLNRLRARVEVQLASVVDSELIGHWTEGPGLTGGELYLFGDGTYVSTDWGCMLPETIHDKGRWKVTAGVLAFEPDRDVTWKLQRGGNRRYVALRLGADVRLFGLDGSLEAFEDLTDSWPADEPGVWLDGLSLSMAERWKGAEGSLRQAELLKTAWRPESYGQVDESTER